MNLFGVINVTRAVLPHMRRRRSGQLVQMSSLNGVEGLAGGAYYAASKFGIEGFSESLAGEVAHLGIKVTIVEPGPFRTRFLDDRSAKWSEPMSDYVDSGDPERAAAAIVQAVTAARPPLRLVLGRMALEHARSVLDGGARSSTRGPGWARRPTFRRPKPWCTWPTAHSTCRPAASCTGATRCASTGASSSAGWMRISMSRA